MSRILAVFRRDLAHVKRNVIALLVCGGLAIMPSLYAWFNIIGGWDPYANTGQVKVALANSDEGVTGSIVPFRINVGERVVSSLAGSKKIGYVVTSEEDAVEGVRSGKYYAALVIPKDFSDNLLSVMTKNPTHPQLDYYVNEKRNAIASIVTGKASGSVQNLVDAGFTEAVMESTADLFDELTGVLDDEGLISLTSTLNGALDESLRAIRRSSDDIKAYKEVVSSIRSVVDSSSTIVGDNSSSLDAASMLSEAAEGVRHFDTAATTAKDAASSAIDAGSAASQDLEVAIDEAFDKADGKVDDLAAALASANDVARARRDDLQSFYDTLDALNGEVYSFTRDLEFDGRVADVDIEYAHTVQNDISDAQSRVSNALSYLDDLIELNDKTVADLQTTKDNSAANRQELKAMAAQAREGIDAVRAGYNDDLSGSLDQLADVIDNAAAEATSISSTLKGTAGEFSPLVADASKGIKELEESLDKAFTRLGKIADKLDDLRNRLSSAVSSGDTELIRTIMGNDPTTLADFFAAPIALDREALYPVENNGSAMTPYYTTMALWVGGTLMGVLLYVALSERALKATKASPTQAYFGRLAFFLLIGACQSTILLLGDLFFLDVQCQHPVLFMLTGWVASTVFINIIYSLATSFGDAGKAIAVFLMVVQVAGSGGTFPVQMLPKPFQMAYPFLPFVHSENAMRSAMFGTYGNDWISEIALLAAFLIPALLLGLVLSKPFAPINEWIEEKLEETKLM